MKVEVDSSRAADGYYKAVPEGAIDTDTHADFRAALAPLLAKAPKVLLLDLSRVDFISSAGLSVLFSVKKQLMDAKGDLLFTGLQPQIKKLFQIVRALPSITLFANADDADRYFYSMMKKEIDKGAPNRRE